jgi:hypothetical protein
MKHQYVIDYEVWEDGNVIKWAAQAVTVDGYEAPNAFEFIEESRESAAEHCGCLKEQIRIRGVWKL